MLKHSLSDNIIAMAAMNIAGASRDSIMLAFAPANISIVSFNPKTRRLETVFLKSYDYVTTEFKNPKPNSIFDVNFNAALAQKARHVRTPSVKFAVDPLNRCFAIQTWDSILNFHTIESDIDEDPAVEMRCEEIGIRPGGILDMCFLGGYELPALLILHQRTPTTVGRRSVSKDTCELLTISLSLAWNKYSVISRSSGLPHTCTRIFPLPKPTFGAFVFSRDGILHYDNQGIDLSFSLSSEGLRRFGGNLRPLFPTKSAEFHLPKLLTLDLACMVSVAENDFLLSDHYGNLMAMHLTAQGQTARDLHLKFVGNCVIPSSIIKLDDHHIFIGSRVGDSQLLEVDRKKGGIDSSTEDEKKSSDIEDPAALDIATLMDLDLDLLSGTGKEDDSDFKFSQNENEKRSITYSSAGSREHRYSRLPTFEVREIQKLLNLGSVNDMMIRPSDQSKYGVGHPEIISACGSGKEGCIRLLTKGTTIRPVTQLNFKKATKGCWSIYGAERDFQNRRFHALVIFSTVSRTILLDTKGDLRQISDKDVIGNEITICAGNVLENKFFIQATPSTVRLLTIDAKKIGEDMKVEEDHYIVEACLCDPYILLRTDLKPSVSETSKPHERIILYQVVLKEDSTGAFLQKIDIAEQIRNLFVTLKAADQNGSKVTSIWLHKYHQPIEKKAVEEKKKGDDTEDLEAFLYGDALDKKEEEEDEEGKEQEAAYSEEFVILLASGEIHGSVSMLTIPDARIWYCAQGVLEGTRLLKDIDTKTHSNDTPKMEVEEMKQKVTITEICFHSIEKDSMPYLFAFTSVGDLFIYRAFSHPEAEESRATFRLQKFEHTLITRSLSAETEECMDYAAANPKAKAGPSTRMNDTWQLGRRIFPFENISGRPGVIIGGHAPVLAVNEYGYLRFHPLLFRSPDSKVGKSGGFQNDKRKYFLQNQKLHQFERSRRGLACVATLHNRRSRDGLLAFTTGGLMQIGSLPRKNKYDLSTEMITQTIPMKSTVLSIAYHPPTQCYCLLLCHEFIAKASVEEKDEKKNEKKDDTKNENAKEEEKNDNQKAEEEKKVEFRDVKFEIKIFSEDTWQEVGSFSKLEPNEQILCQAVVTLSNKTFLALGTSKVVSEDAISRGRVILLEIYFAGNIEEDKEEEKVSQHEENNHAEGSKAAALGADEKTVDGNGKSNKSTSDERKGKLGVRAYSQYEKGPVCCVDQIDSRLVVTVAAKVLIYQWNAEQRSLIGRGFYDCKFFIVKTRVIRNYILTGDYRNGLHLIAWDRDMRLLVNVARDPGRCKVLGIEYGFYGNSIGFVCTNSEKRLQIYRFRSDDEDSRVGQKLLAYADCYLGLRGSCLRSLRCRLLLQKESKKRKLPTGELRSTPKTDIRTVTIGGTLEGAFFSVMPVDQAMRSRLHALGGAMVRSMYSFGGVNPIASRRRGTSHRRLKKAQTIVDGDLLKLFLSLDVETQTEIVSNLGTTRSTVIEDMLQLHLASTLSA